MNLSPIRKVFQGVADRHQMFRMFDRHAQRPNRWEGDDSALYRGEWFEILPPLWMKAEMFAMREFLTDSITSVFFMLPIDGRILILCWRSSRQTRSQPMWLKGGRQHEHQPRHGRSQ